MSAEHISAPNQFESTEASFDALADRAAARFLAQPFNILTTPSGELFTSAMTIEGAVHQTLKEMVIEEDAAGALRGNLVAHLINTHPEFLTETYHRWRRYSNKPGWRTF